MLLCPRVLVLAGLEAVHEQWAWQAAPCVALGGQPVLQPAGARRGPQAPAPHPFLWRPG